MTTLGTPPKTNATDASPGQHAASSATGSLVGLRVAYLMNQHPMTSVSFVRREISGMEEAGADVVRFSIRRWPGEAVDPADRVEVSKTEILLVGWVWLLWDAVACLTRSPIRFVNALVLTLKIGWKSDRGLLRYLIYFIEGCRLSRRLNALGLPWVHAHFGTNSAAVAMISRLLGGPEYSFTVHGPEEFDRPELLHLRTKIRHASLVIAISHFGRSQLFRWARYEDWHKIQIVRCGINDSFRGPVQPPPESPQLVSVARLAEQKGIPVLIQAAGRLKQQGRSFHLSIIGDGPLRQEVTQLISHFGVQSQVTLMGWASESTVRETIEMSRALVLPSFAEGLPVVIMESLALQRPVITTQIAGIPELVKHGVNGWLVPAGDVNSLVSAMEAALDADPHALHQMGKAGAESVFQKHLAGVESVRLGNLIRRCLSSGTDGIFSP